MIWAVALDNDVSRLGRLHGRRVVITGSGGISLAVAELAVRAGASVHMIARDEQTMRSDSAEHPEYGWSFADLQVDEETARAFSEADGQLGGIDGLVAVAGGSARALGDGAIDRLTGDALRRTLDLNLTTTVNSLREFLSRAHPAEDRHCAAVLIGSVLASSPASPLFVTHGYAAAKAGIEGLARAAAAHNASRGVTVNVVAAGLTRTAMSKRAQGDAVVSEYAARRQPLTADGFLEPTDIGDACCWLLGAATVTGQVVTVDGGWSVFG